MSKLLHRYTEANGFDLLNVNFRFKNTVTKGFDIVDKDKNILATVEPTAAYRIEKNKFVNAFILSVKGENHHTKICNNMWHIVRELNRLNLKAGHTGFKRCG